MKKNRVKAERIAQNIWQYLREHTKNEETGK